MLTREEVIACAWRLAAHDPAREPLGSVGPVFTRDGGESWAVHLLECNEPRVVGDVLVQGMQRAHVAFVCGRTGAANWAPRL